MKNKEKKVVEPSINEAEYHTQFFTLVQAKKELESFAKEKELNFQFHTHDDDDDDCEIPSSIFSATIEIGGRVRVAVFKLNVLPMVPGCFRHHLERMKMIIERMSHAEIPFYNCNVALCFDAREDSLNMHHGSPSDPTNHLWLKIDFVLDVPGVGFNTRLSAYKMHDPQQPHDDISRAIYSHDGKLTLLDNVYITGLQDIENSHMLWHKVNGAVPDEMKSSAWDEKLHVLFRPNKVRDNFIGRHALDCLIKICKFDAFSTNNTGFAVTAALAEVLESDGVEVLDAFSYPSYGAGDYYGGADNRRPIVVAVSFSINGKKFVYHKNNNFNEFCIDEVGTTNRLVIKGSTDSNIKQIRSVICRFLGM